MLDKGFGKEEAGEVLVTPEMAALDEEVKTKLDQAEKLGEEGEVDASMALMEEVAAMKKK